MRKHRIDKIREISGASVELCPADTAEETAAFIAELVAIGEKLPSGSVPGESLAQILADYKKPREIIVNDVSGNRVSVAGGVKSHHPFHSSEIGSSLPTKNDFIETTKNDGIEPTFTESELLILKQF